MSPYHNPLPAASSTPALPSIQPHFCTPQFLHPSLHGPSVAVLQNTPQAAPPALKPCQQLGAEGDLALRPENQPLNLAAGWHKQPLSLQGLGTAERRYGGGETEGKHFFTLDNFQLPQSMVCTATAGFAHLEMVLRALAASRVVALTHRPCNSPFLLHKPPTHPPCSTCALTFHCSPVHAANKTISGRNGIGPSINGNH